MTAYFVDSVSGNNTTGSSWTNAYTNLTGAFAVAVAGDTIWVGDDHAQTQASTLTLTSAGTTSSLIYVYCVDHTVASPGTVNLKTTATITTTGSNAITLTGYAYFYGITFNSATGSGSAAFSIGSTTAGYLIFDTCGLVQGNTAGNFITFGGTTSGVPFECILKGTTVKFGAVGQGMAIRSGNFYWKNTASAIQGATIPTTLFVSSSPLSTNARIQGVDLSAAGSGKTLVGAIAADQYYLFEGCKLGSSVTVATTPTALGGGKVDIRNCDSTTGYYRQERYWQQGTLTASNTYYNNAGATDGTTNISWKVVSTANVAWEYPFACFQSQQVVLAAGVGVSKTITIEIMNTSALTLNNDQVWGEVAYMGSTTTPLFSFTNNTKANNLASGSALASSGATWTVGAGSPTAQNFTLTFTPQEVGYFMVTIYVADPSITVYIDPLIH